MTSETTLPEPGRAGKPGDICETPSLRALTNLFLVCHQMREIGIVTGEPGVGKTSAARRYVAQNSTGHLVTMSPASSALVPCLARIGAAISAFPSGTGACAWSDAIRTAFAYDPDPHVLLIDEAHHLSDQAVEEIRSIFDVASMGVVFIGSRELRDRWTGRRWAQLTSRVYLRNDLEAPQAGDIDAICEAAHINGRPSRTLLTRAAAKPGGLRLIRKVTDAAVQLAGPGNPVTLEHVQRALASRGETAA